MDLKRLSKSLGGMEAYSVVWDLRPEDYEECFLEEIELSTRLYNILKLKNIHTIGDLLQHNPNELLELKNCGMHSMNEIARLMDYIARLKLNKDPSLQKGKSHESNFSTKVWFELLKKYIELELMDFLNNNKQLAEIFGFLFNENEQHAFARLDLTNDEKNVLRRLDISEEKPFLAFRLGELKKKFSRYDRAIEDFSTILIKRMQLKENQFKKEEDIIHHLLNKIPKDRKKERVFPYLKLYRSRTSYHSLFKRVYLSEDAKVEEFDVLALSTIEDYWESIEFLKWIAFDLSELIHHIIHFIAKNERQQRVLKARAAGFTLEEIGKDFRVTRERVRQMESKILYAFRRKLLKFNIFKFLLFSKKDQTVLYYEEIHKYAKDQTDVFIYLLRNTFYDDIEYDEKQKVFIFKTTEIEKNMDDLLNSLPRIFLDNEYEKILIEGAKKYHLTPSILEFVIHKAYSKTGKVYHKGSLRLKDIYIKGVKEYYPDGIKLNDEEIEDLKNRIEKNYGINLSNKSNRSIAARIAGICMLCDKSTYKAYQSEDYLSKDLLERIKDYILNEPQDVLLFQTIFLKFEKELTIQGVDNRYFLQGILRLNYEEMFSFSKDYIAKKGEPLADDYRSIILEFIKNKKDLVSKKELKEQFPGLSDVMLSALLENEKILKYYRAYLHVDNLKITNQDVETLQNEIKKVFIFYKTYSIMEMYKRIKARMPDLLERNRLTMPTRFKSVIQYLFKENYLFEEGMISKKKGVHMSNERTEVVKKPPLYCFNTVIRPLLSDPEMYGRILYNICVYCGVSIRRSKEFLDGATDEKLLEQLQQMSVSTLLEEPKKQYDFSFRLELPLHASIDQVWDEMLEIVESHGGALGGGSTNVSPRMNPAYFIHHWVDEKGLALFQLKKRSDLVEYFEKTNEDPEVLGKKVEKATHREITKEMFLDLWNHFIK